ncbi:MAG: serine/threonine-protein kinase [Polyangiaceae bacterium]
MATDSEDPLGLRGTLLAQKYLVGSAVGDGGYSVVYRAEHTIWREPVALKLFTALARVGEEEREQLLAEFIQEGKLLAALSSRSATIVQARDFGTVLTPDGAWIPYMVLEWVDGQPLDQVLDGERQRGLPPRTLHEAMALLEPLATGLHTAHSRGVVHRDVKPENVLVLGDPRGVAPALKLLDFGVAKVMDVQNALLAETGSGPMSFTPRYGAPEQFSRRFGATGPWTDVYALALVMVEVLRGSVLWEEDDCVRLMHIASDPERRPTPAAFGLQVGSAVESVFQRALAIHPAERYRSVGEMWGALHGAVFPGAARWGSSSGAGSSITPLSVEQMEVPALRAPRALPRRRRAPPSRSVR